MTRIGATAIFLLWVLGSLYAGVGGMTQVEIVRMQKEAQSQPQDEIDYEGKIFYNASSFRVFQQGEKLRNVFPWATALPEFAGLVLTACAFGALGGTARMAKQVVIDEEQLEDIDITMRAIFGALLGMMVLGLSYVFPAALTQNESVELRTSTLLFLCFFAGVFTVKVHRWMEDQVDRIFPAPAPVPASGKKMGKKDTQEGKPLGKTKEKGTKSREI